MQVGDYIIQQRYKGDHRYMLIFKLLDIHIDGYLSVEPQAQAKPADPVLDELRPIYADLAKQMRAIGQEPCKPPANPTPAQVQACIDEMTTKLRDFDAIGKEEALPA